MATLKYKTNNGYVPLPTQVVRKTNEENGFGIGVCSTAAATAAKEVAITNYELVKNGFVAIRFTYDVPANATLNINSKGAKAIYHNGAALAANVIKAGDKVTMVYNGTQYDITCIEHSVGTYTKTQVDALTRHTRLTDFDLSVLKQAVADQNLEKYGLKVGDYKTINGRDYVIAGLNPMKGTATPYRLTVNHVGLIVIPHTTQSWNASGKTDKGADDRGAGYANSDLHYYLVNTLLPLVRTDLGADNLLKHSKMLSNAVNTTGYNKSGENTGCASGSGWVTDQYISALSEVQVFGSVIWSSSGYDIGEACKQLEVFQKYSHTEIFGGEYVWLRDVVSASHAARAYYYGSADYRPASYAFYVAALILFN